ncbi:putative acetyltransferase [Microbacterium sp. SORGH_AS428]|uniref:GNAT family N-acetyltransferase n=1 Tax=Microbacterium sp. SORGH_AS_0428 TaxID=3041788 RepID=UPI0028661E44|nr:GNAT family N-acetyltransferase [Microbacterium sp. SORGH_AS_0428]MDR6199154.1 putative acetyltransferase [Microbacterium sp. SORGH_AS_0428]
MDDSAALRVALRPYSSADAAATLAVFTDAITQTASAHYTPEQIEAWARPGRRDLPAWDEAMSGRGSIVAVAGDEVVGFSDVGQDGYIDMLFVSPRHVRRGIARSLLAFIESRARSSGIAELTSDVSVAARLFFESVGFEIVREQRPIKEGVALTNFRMRKLLTGGSVALSAPRRR